MEKLDYSNFTDLFEAATFFALRFKGYEYRDDNKEFNDYKNYQKLMGDEEISDEELLPTLFCIQRDLARGQHRLSSKVFKIFWAIFLKTIKLETEIPEKYQNEKYIKRWGEIKKDSEEIIKEAEKLAK